MENNRVNGLKSFTLNKKINFFIYCLLRRASPGGAWQMSLLKMYHFCLRDQSIESRIPLDELSRVALTAEIAGLLLTLVG